VVPVISMGVDQAKRSGWGIARDRTVVRWGIARTARDRAAVVALARELAGGSLQSVYVMMEDHTQMKLQRLQAGDRSTQRAPGDRWVQRSTASIIGIGDARGRWREQLELAGHPVALLDQIDPLEWRRRMGIHGRDAKTLACRVAEQVIGMAIGTLTDDDLAEGVCLTLFAATEGRLRDALRKQTQRADSKTRKQLRSQGVLRLDETGEDT
jgi:hypothetical protein